MKVKLILANWMLSLCGLSIDTERSPFWAVALMIGWFAGASLLFNYADRKGWLDELNKQFNIDEV